MNRKEMEIERDRLLKEAISEIKEMKNQVEELIKELKDERKNSKGAKKGL